MMLKINFKAGQVNRERKYKSATPMKLIKRNIVGYIKIRMFKNDSKYRLPIVIISVIVSLYLSVRGFYNYAVGEDKGMSLIGGIIFGIGTIMYSIDLFEYRKNKKSINSRAE